MAQAPDPVALREQREAKTTVTVRIKGESWSLSPMAIPFGVRAKIRKATGGQPLMSYLVEGGVDVDTVVICVWAARMVAGETDLTVDEVDAGFDWETIGPDDFDIDVHLRDDESITADSDPS